MDLEADDELIVCVGVRARGREQVEHPPHYNWHPRGIEYIFRSGGTVTKGDVETDLEKAIWYLRRELERLRDGRTGRGR
jgi:hypothetical protein